MINIVNKAHLYALTLSVLVLASCGGGTSPDTVTEKTTSGVTRISVDETFRPIIETQVNTFEGIYKYARIEASYKAEGAAINDLLNDSTRMIIVSRELTENEKQEVEQRKLVPRTYKIAVDAIALIVNRNNPDSLLTMDQVRDIFNGKITSWGQINDSDNKKDITIVFDNNNSSTARYVKDSLITDGKLPSNTFASNSHSALIDYVQKNENAIGVTGVNWISDRDDTTAVNFLNKIRVVGISTDPAPFTTESYYQPYQAYIAQGVYPLTRNLYIVSTEARTGLGTGFAAFIQGDSGQRIVLKSGLVPATMPIRVVSIKE